jgi:hypothetical protein
MASSTPERLWAAPRAAKEREILFEAIANGSVVSWQDMGIGEQRSSYGTRSITVLMLMESATLWKVDATEAALRAEAGLDRFP